MQSSSIPVKLDVRSSEWSEIDGRYDLMLESHNLRPMWGCGDKRLFHQKGRWRVEQGGSTVVKSEHGKSLLPTSISWEETDGTPLPGTTVEELQRQVLSVLTTPKAKKDKAHQAYTDRNQQAHDLQGSTRSSPKISKNAPQSNYVSLVASPQSSVPNYKLIPQREIPQTYKVILKGDETTHSSDSDSSFLNRQQHTPKTRKKRKKRTQFADDERVMFVMSTSGEPDEYLKRKLKDTELQNSRRSSDHTTPGRRRDSIGVRSNKISATNYYPNQREKESIADTSSLYARSREPSHSAQPWSRSQSDVSTTHQQQLLVRQLEEMANIVGASERRAKHAEEETSSLKQQLAGTKRTEHPITWEDIQTTSPGGDVSDDEVSKLRMQNARLIRKIAEVDVRPLITTSHNDSDSSSSTSPNDRELKILKHRNAVLEKRIETAEEEAATLRSRSASPNEEDFEDLRRRNAYLEGRVKEAEQQPAALPVSRSSSGRSEEIRRLKESNLILSEKIRRSESPLRDDKKEELENLNELNENLQKEVLQQNRQTDKLKEENLELQKRLKKSEEENKRLQQTENDSSSDSEDELLRLQLKASKDEIVQLNEKNTSLVNDLQSAITSHKATYEEKQILQQEHFLLSEEMSRAITGERERRMMNNIHHERLMERVFGDRESGWEYERLEMLETIQSHELREETFLQERGGFETDISILKSKVQILEKELEGMLTASLHSNIQVERQEEELITLYSQASSCSTKKVDDLTSVLSESIHRGENKRKISELEAKLKKAERQKQNAEEESRRLQQQLDSQPQPQPQLGRYRSPPPPLRPTNVTPPPAPLQPAPPPPIAPVVSGPDFSKIRWGGNPTDDQNKISHHHSTTTSELFTCHLCGSIARSPRASQSVLHSNNEVDWSGRFGLGTLFLTDRIDRNLGGWSKYYLLIVHSEEGRDEFSTAQLPNTCFTTSDWVRLLSSDKIRFSRHLPPDEFARWKQDWPWYEQQVYDNKPQGLLSWNNLSHN